MPVPVLAILAGAAIAWNLLTDWIWIGGSFGVMPEGEKKDIQNRAISIINIVDSAKAVVYAVQKMKRRPNSLELNQIKTSAAEARKQLKDLQDTYSKKFSLYGKNDVAEALNRTVKSVELQIQAMEIVAGLRLADKVTPLVLNVPVKIVYDGDTIGIDVVDEVASIFGPSTNFGPKQKVVKSVIVRLVGIDAPESTTVEGQKSKAYLINRIEGKMVRIESDPNAETDIYGRRLGVVYIGNENINLEMIKKGYAKYYAFEPNALVYDKQWKAANGGTLPSAPAQPVRVFTGIVTQGKLNPTASFTPRENDLINDIDELTAAAQNNLAAYLVSIPNKLSYEVKIVSSVISKDGFITRGAVQTVITGYKKDGTPKTKNVVNKFAQLNIYIIGAKGTRTKIDTINLGPVDATTFQPTLPEIEAIQNRIKSNVATSDVGDIDVSAAMNPTTMKLLTYDDVLKLTASDLGRPEVLRLFNRPFAEENPIAFFGSNFEDSRKNLLSQFELSSQLKDLIDTFENWNNPKTIDAANDVKRKTLDQIDYMVSDFAAFGFDYKTTPQYKKTIARLAGEVSEGESGLPKSNNPNKCNVMTIAEFFDTNRTSYPALAERAKFWELWGLGNASSYIGTAEQNTRWLIEAKRRSGC